MTHDGTTSDQLNFNTAFLDDLDNSVLCWLATVDADGCPSVSPKEMFMPYGDHHLLIANIASPNSVRNIRAHPQVCVSFLDVFRQKGFKVLGTAELIEKDDPRYETVGRDIITMAGPDYQVQSLILVEAKRIQRILAPSYRLFPERTEQEHIARTMATYGVKSA